MPKPLYLISTTAVSIAAAFALQLPSAEKHAANTSPAATYARSISPPTESASHGQAIQSQRRSHHRPHQSPALGVLTILGGK